MITQEKVLHINADHPISENGTDDVHVEQGMNNVLAYGGKVSVSTGNSAKRLAPRNGPNAPLSGASTRRTW